MISLHGAERCWHYLLRKVKYIMFEKLFVNHRLKFMQYKFDLYIAYLGRNSGTVIVDGDTISILRRIGEDGIAREELEVVIDEINFKLDKNKVLERLKKQRMLVEKKPKYNWKSNTYGISRIGEKEISAVVETIKSKRLFRYEYQTIESIQQQNYMPCKKLEEEIAKLVGVNYCVAMNSGTSALECAFSILGIGKGDEVICPAYNYIGSAVSMLHKGAKPVLCNIDETYMLALDEIEKHITGRTKAILCTHLQGKMAQIEKINEIAKRRGLFLIEDCAQALGAEIRGKKAGSFGDVACFSFHQHKIISAGEGGAITMNDENLYKKAILFSDVSRTFLFQDSINYTPSHNMRMPEINAAIMLTQLNYLEEFSKHLKSIYEIFSEKLSNNKNVKLEKIINFEGALPQSIYLRFQTSEMAHKSAEFLESLGVPAKVLLCQNEININVFLWWPGVVENIEKEIYSKELEKTLKMLSRTISIPLGIDIDYDMVENLCEDMNEYYRSMDRCSPDSGRL